MGRRPILSYDQAVAFLLDLVRDEPRPYQARAALAQQPVQALLSRLGNPQTDLPVVHIAGSKGKGSTALYLEAILSALGLRSGCFTSPHLQRWTERFRIAGRESTPQEFATLFARVQPHVDDLLAQAPTTAPSFFDVLSAAALLLFAEQHVDCAVIEAGIGGRLDATNVVQPMLACITSVELEHTDKLGTSIAAIAGEKAGIIKAGTPLIIGSMPADAEALMRRRAASLGAEVSALGRELALDTQPAADGSLAIRVRANDWEYHAQLPAAASGCAAVNAALAIACAQRVAGHDRPRLQHAIASALAQTQPPGRMEILSERPWVVIDGAHTLASARALADMLRALPANDTYLLISLSANRDATRLLAPLLERAHRVVVTCAAPGRSMDSRRLAADLMAGGLPASRVQVIPDPRTAVAETHAALARDDLLCVAGSMYMAGVARETLIGADRTPARLQSP